MSSISINNIIGRFAPSPTGPLHLGSLIAATASYLNVRQYVDSHWLLRIEDLDTQRSQAAHSTTIISQLEQYGFKWDGEIVYQSQRTQAYQEAFNQLTTSVFPCICTRKTLQATAQSQFSYIYPGTCRDQPIDSISNPYSYRLITAPTEICFTDKIQGEFCQNLATDVGDFIIKRVDGSFSYQLAVVVDDAWQGINQITRGADLLDNTPRQLYLQKLLELPQPSYTHFPVITTNDGKKLSKQNSSPAISNKHKRAALINVLRFLGQNPPDASEFANLDDLWSFAMQNWSHSKIPKILSQTIPTRFNHYE